MTTKEQELKALRQIEKIVENLGENSYLATAFEGCFEIAEQNIENDFACSMKQRAEAAEAQSETLAAMLKAATANATDLEDALTALTEANEGAAKIYEERIAKLRMKTFSVDRYKQIWTLVYDKIEYCKGCMSQSANIMADLAATPKDIAFVNAVTQYRNRRDELTAAEDLLEYLDKINPEEV